MSAIGDRNALEAAIDRTRSLVLPLRVLAKGVREGRAASPHEAPRPDRRSFSRALAGRGRVNYSDAATEQTERTTRRGRRRRWGRVMIEYYTRASDRSRLPSGSRVRAARSALEPAPPESSSESRVVIPSPEDEAARTHLSLQKDAPIPRAVQTVGQTLAVPILGGLHPPAATRSPLGLIATA